MSLRHELGFDADASFLSWLLGNETARGRTGSDLHFKIAKSLSLVIRRGSFIEFSSASVLSGKTIGGADLDGISHKIVLDAFDILLPAASIPSIVAQPHSERTLISLLRGSQEWGLKPHLPVPPGSRLHSEGEVFDALTIEAGESRNRQPSYAFLADSTSPKANLSYVPHANLKNSAGDPCSLALKNPKYAFSDEDQHKALIADFADDVVKLTVNQSVLHISNSDSTGIFAFTARGSELLTSQCEPTLSAITIPLEGGVVVDRHRNGRLSFVTSGQAISINPDVAAIVDGANQEAWIPLTEKKVIRAEDLLALEFQFQNLQLHLRPGERPRVTRIDTRIDQSAPTTIIMTFVSPQHVVEQTFRAFPSDPRTRPQTRIAGKSRLVFIPSKKDLAEGFPYTLEDLLCVCCNAELKVTANALTKYEGGPIPISPPYLPVLPPTPDVTAIEAPYRIILSPNKFGAWTHSLRPVTQDGTVIDCESDRRKTLPASSELVDAAGDTAVDQTSAPTPRVLWTELWHTRLATRSVAGSKPSESDPRFRTLRAIWSPDYQTPLPAGKPFDLPMQGTDRRDLVNLTFEIDDNSGSSPDKVKDRLSRVIDVQRLMLTSLGAWMDVTYAQDPPVGQAAGHGPTLELWRHVMTTGRDQYVKVAHKGFLYPWGHRVSHITISERLFHDVQGETVAYLIKTEFLVVKERTHHYSSSDPFDWRAMFRNVTIKEDKEIQIDPTVKIIVPDSTPAGREINAFWINVGGKHYPFPAEGIDQNGGTVGFFPGAIFVGADILAGSDPLNTAARQRIREVYLENASQYARYLAMNGQPISYAPGRDQNDYSTMLETAFIKFESQDRGSFFYPVIESAEVQIPAVKLLREQELSTVVRYNNTYLTRGIDGRDSDGLIKSVPENRGQVFLDVSPPVVLDFNTAAEKSGVVVAPRINVIALSRLTGIVGGEMAETPARKVYLDEFAGGKYVPEIFFEDIKLFNQVDLKTLLKVINDFPAQLAQVPRMTYQKSLSPPGEAVEARFDWAADLTPQGERTPKITILARRANSLDSPSDRTCVVDGKLTDFLIDQKQFEMRMKVEYKSENDKPFEFGAESDLGRLKQDSEFHFTGSLFNKILQLFTQAFTKLGTLAFDTSLIVLKFTIRPPDFDFGMFTLHNLSLAAAIRIGLIGQVTGFDFKVSDPTEPCVVTVAMFYGKGYLIIRADPLCLASVDTSIEFGASIHWDILGIATLDASVSASIRYQLLMDDVVRLTGTLSCHGSLSVLGLITVGVGFDAALTLASGNTTLVCEVSIYVEIDLFLFSETIRVPLKFTFDGGGGRMLGESSVKTSRSRSSPSTFTGQMTKSNWRAYCDAFA